MKKEQDVCILAHAYQSQDILEVADYMGDSYGLSVQASKSRCKNVIMCGVRFMAETCKAETCMAGKSDCRMSDGRTAGSGVSARIKTEIPGSCSGCLYQYNI